MWSLSYMWNTREIGDVTAVPLSIMFKWSLGLREVSNKWERENFNIFSRRTKRRIQQLWATQPYLSPCIDDGAIIHQKYF